MITPPIVDLRFSWEAIDVEVKKGEKAKAREQFKTWFESWFEYNEQEAFVYLENQKKFPVYFEETDVQGGKNEYLDFRRTFRF